jgi:hypothetical protein
MRNRSQREGSHLLQSRQRRVHSNRICEAGNSHVANLVSVKAGRFTRTHHKPLRKRDELVEVAWWKNGDRGGFKRGTGPNGRVRTYSKIVNVAFTRIISAKLVAPTSLILLQRRLEDSPEHITNPHANGTS